MKHIIAMTVGGAILTAIAGLMFGVPHGEAILLVVSLLMIAYGLGSMVLGYVDWKYDSKRIEEMKKEYQLLQEERRNV